MNILLKTAVAQVYAVFDKYLLNTAMDACSCCVSEVERNWICSRLLQELTASDLMRYSGKAMTTWGNETDFKHFLPRILELLYDLGEQYDIDIVLGKLDYARWKTWPAEEKKAIIDFLTAWWADTIDKKLSSGAAGYLIAVAKYSGDIGSLLSIWTDKDTEQALINLVEFIYSDCQLILLKKRIGSHRDKNDKFVPFIEAWLASEPLEKKLEKAFFDYEDKDEEFASLISAAFEIIKGVQKSMQTKRSN